MATLKKHNHSTIISVTPTIVLTAYSQYDVVGGVMTLNLGSGGMLRRIKIQDDDDQKEPYKLYLFRADPDIADDAAFAPTDAELDDLIDVVSVVAGDYEEWGGANTVAILNNLSVDIADTDPVISCYAVAQDTPDYAAVTALTFEFTFWVH